MILPLSTAVPLLSGNYTAVAVKSSACILMSTECRTQLSSVHLKSPQRLSTSVYREGGCLSSYLLYSFSNLCSMQVAERQLADGRLTAKSLNAEIERLTREKKDLSDRAEATKVTALK